MRTCSKHVPWRNLCGCRLAAWLVERQHHSSFVAAFSQGASGDVSPNVIRRARGSTAEFELSGEGATPRESVLIAAQRQACRHAPSRTCCIVARHVTCCLFQREPMPVRRSAAAHFLPAWLRAELCVVASAVATPAGERLRCAVGAWRASLSLGSWPFPRRAARPGSVVPAASRDNLRGCAGARGDGADICRAECSDRPRGVLIEEPAGRACQRTPSMHRSTAADVRSAEPAACRCHCAPGSIVARCVACWTLFGASVLLYCNHSVPPVVRCLLHGCMIFVAITCLPLLASCTMFVLLGWMFD